MILKPIGTNQTVLTNSKGRILFSYSTPVAAYLADTAEYIRTEKHYGTTTSRHINKWLGGMSARTVPQEEIDALTA